MSVVVAASLAVALDALRDRPEATVLVGGTDLMVAVNDGRARPDAVLAVARVPELRTIEVDGSVLAIGAAVTYAELMRPPVAESVPALVCAARTVGSPQIRNAGTIGGNLATASPAGDTLPVLVSLGAEIELASYAATRRVPITEFLLGPKRTALAAGELVTAVRVPLRRGPQDYLKVGVRNAMVIAVASLAFSIDLDARRAGAGLGSVGPTALSAPDACAWLASQLEWRADGVDAPEGVEAEFGRRVVAASAPIDDHRGTASYRQRAIETLARRALRRAVA